MAEKTHNLQDTFLNHVRKAKIPLTIFLVNGVKLQGVVTRFDNFCLLLRRDGHSQLVYKHAISTIMPGRPLDLAAIHSVEAKRRPALQDVFLSAAERERLERERGGVHERPSELGRRWRGGGAW